MVTTAMVSCIPEGERVRAATYLRVSTEGQAGDGKVSLAVQQKGCGQLFERPGWEAINQYEDHCSGDAFDRPGLQQMVRDAKAGLFNVIVVYKMDRLGRAHQMDYLIAELVQCYGVRVVSVKEGDDPMALAVYAAVSGVDKVNILSRTKMGKDGKAMQGRLPGGSHPFGYRRGRDGRPEVDPATGPLVVELFELYAGKALTGELAAAEVEESACQLDPGFLGLSRSHAYKILQKPLYWEGVMHHGQRDLVLRSGKRCPVLRPEEECIQIPFPPLVSKELWDRAQVQKAEAMKESPRSMKRCYPLQGLAVCEHCIQPFRVKSDSYGERRENGQRVREKTDTHVRRYYCFTCERPSILAEELEGEVWTKVSRVLCSPDLLWAGAATLNPESDRVLETEIAEAKKTLKDIGKQLERVRARDRKGDLEAAELDSDFKLLRGRRKFWRDRLKSCRPG